MAFALLPGALRGNSIRSAYAYWAFRYSRTWRGSLATSFLNPILYLAAMGMGLGSYVKNGGAHHQLGSVDYLTYIAPGLLAATAMQVAAGEASWPVMGSIKWWKTYHAMLATPLGVVEVMLGHVLWMATRVLLVSTVFFVVMAGFGAVASPIAVLAIPAAVLTGVAFAAPITALAAHMDNDTGFNVLFRFAIMPMFLFSGTFFPVSQLPGPLQPIAWITPLWHGVDLCRSLALGDVGWLAVGHVGYLLTLAVIGLLLAARVYRRRLRV